MKIFFKKSLISKPKQFYWFKTHSLPAHFYIVSISSKIYLLQENVLDLSVLDKERKKLNGAQKITIYVHESVYLTTDINLEWIEIQRISSYKDKQPHDLKSSILSYVWP